MKITTVREQGMVLPASGFPFVVEPLTGEMEHDVIKLLSTEPRFMSGLQWQVLCVLSICLEKLGERHYGSLPASKRMAEIEKMGLTLGDALYLYLWARIQSLDSTLKITVTCTECDAETPGYKINLEDLNVQISEKDELLEKEITLLLPVTLGDKKLTKAVVFPVQFRPKVAELDTYADAKWEILSESCKFPEYEFPVVTDMIKRWPKKVIDQLFEAVDDIGPGIVDQTRFKCPECKSLLPMKVSWRYSNFFG